MVGKYVDLTESYKSLTEALTRTDVDAVVVATPPNTHAELVLEAVRQVRGTSTSQVERNDVAMVIGGPMVTPVSNLLLGSEAVL